MLTDHYDPRSETLSLSEGVYHPQRRGHRHRRPRGGPRHAEKEGYAPLHLRTMVVPR